MVTPLSPSFFTSSDGSKFGPSQKIRTLKGGCWTTRFKRLWKRCHFTQSATQGSNYPISKSLSCPVQQINNLWIKNDPRHDLSCMSKYKSQSVKGKKIYSFDLKLFYPLFGFQCTDSPPRSVSSVHGHGVKRCGTFSNQ